MTQHEDPPPLDAQVVTFGCRLNSYESELIRSHLKASDLSNTIVFNTCAVTEEAERQVLQALRKARRDNPHAMIIATGCAAHIRPDFYQSLEEVDLVIDNHAKTQAQTFHSLRQGGLPAPVPSAQEDPPLVTHFENKTRAFLEVQNGCDHDCTFCVIPKGRGKSRSVPLGQILQRMEALWDAGHKEIVLTGVDITDYGKDLPGQLTLTQALRRLLQKLPATLRLRLSSLDPAELGDDFFSLFQEEPRLLPYLHLSLQSGCDIVLKRMKRRHLRQDLIAFCEKARQARPDVVFGADVIAGFPTETETNHQETLALLKALRIGRLHVFPFSARTGTPAAKMPQCPPAQIRARAKDLRLLGAEILSQEMARQVGQRAQVLIEKQGPQDSLGKSEHFFDIRLEGAFSPGSLVPSLILKQEGKNLWARPL